MAREIEMKLAVPDAGAATAVAQWLDRHGEPAGAFDLANVYFDTPDAALARSRAALRLRRYGDRWLQTLKTAGRSEDGLAVRDEWETAVDGDALQPERLPADAQALLAPLQERLMPVFRTDFQRRVWCVRRGGGEIEVALDAGVVCAIAARPPAAQQSLLAARTDHGATEAIHELELEWLDAPVEGGAGGVDVAATLRALADELGAVAPLRPSDLSKAARGYRLAGLAGPSGTAGSDGGAR